MNGDNGQPYSVAMTSTPAPGAPSGNQCRSIAAIAARAWSVHAKMARARTAAALAADPQLAATLGAPDALGEQKELMVECEGGRVLATHVTSNLLIVLIAVPGAPGSAEDGDGGDQPALRTDGFGMLRKKAAAAKKLLEPPLREWCAERERLVQYEVGPQQSAAVYTECDT